MMNDKCEVLENKLVAPGHFVLTFRSKKIAGSAKPGQFVQIQCGDSSAFDPLLARPFSFFTSRGSEFSILYHVVGKGTGRMSHLRKKDKVSVLGPLGNGFGVGSELGARSSELMVLVGGGVGIPPLYHLAETVLKNKKMKKGNIHVFLGARNKSLLLCEKDFKNLGVSLSVATDDGSRGFKGFVTSLLISFLRPPTSDLRACIYTCGPTPMLKAVSRVSGEFLTPCEVAVEVPMACGFGACLGCAIKVKNQKSVVSSQKSAGKMPNSDYRLPITNSLDYRFAIACTEGPVFQGSDILWD